MSEAERPPDNEDEAGEDPFFEALESHLDNERFRKRVILFQRCDNALRPLWDNLEELQPATDEELAVYVAFLSAAELILAEMKPFLPEKTHRSLTGRLDVYRTKMTRQMRRSAQAADGENHGPDSTTG